MKTQRAVLLSFACLALGVSVATAQVLNPGKDDHDDNGNNKNDDNKEPMLFVLSVEKERKTLVH